MRRGGEGERGKGGGGKGKCFRWLMFVFLLAECASKRKGMADHPGDLGVRAHRVGTGVRAHPMGEGCARTRFPLPQGETDGGARAPREYGGGEGAPYAYAVLESMEFRAERVGTGGSPPSQAGTKIQSLEKK